MLGLKTPQGLNQVFLLILFIKIHHTWHAAVGPMEDRRELENSEFFKKNQHIPTPGNRHGDESRLNTDINELRGHTGDPGGSFVVPGILHCITTERSSLSRSYTELQRKETEPEGSLGHLGRRTAESAKQDQT